MPTEKDIRKTIKDVFSEKEKPPSNKNYLLILLVVVIIGFSFYFVLAQIGIVPPLWDTGAIKSSSDVSQAVSEISKVISNASDTIDNINQQI